jgi:nitrogen regulatory protein A
MINSNNDIIQDELDSLRNQTASDFSGLAWMDQHDNRIRWFYVSGNSNERFKRLALKPGRGLAGIVLRLGRPLIIDSRLPNLERTNLQHEYSIMLVEDLLAAIAFPIKIQDETRGVLLIGDRSDRYYEENIFPLLSKWLGRFELLIQ